MDIHVIRKISEPVLRQVAQPLPLQEIATDSIQSLIDEMFATMDEAGGVGLAAPQVGLSQRLFVLAVNDVLFCRRRKFFYGLQAPVAAEVWINPTLTHRSHETVEDWETCLSVPGYGAHVRRFEKIGLRGYDRHGELREMEAEGFHAKIIQHEMDHLDGLFYIDRVQEVYRREPSLILGSRYQGLTDADR